MIYEIAVLPVHKKQIETFICRWAKRGSRPSAPHDQRTRSAYIFGAIYPIHGKAAALVMPWCDTPAMNQHLIELARNVAGNAHAMLIMDLAGWHMSNKLTVPENITILPLPPKSPELNPVEEHLAGHVGQLALKPCLQILRQHLLHPIHEVAAPLGG